MLAYPIYALRYLLWAIGNLLRRLGKAPNYVLFTLQGEYDDLPHPAGNFIQRRLRPPRLSLLELSAQFHTVAKDPRVRGVVLHLRPLAMPAAQLETLRDMIKELHAAGKVVVAWSHNYTTANYYVACAAGKVLLQPGGNVHPLGMNRRYFYLADALRRAGVQGDFVQISPYKSAGDMFSRSSMSDEVREMANWLMDAAYDEFTHAMAEGRGVDQTAARALVDQTPCTDLKARELDLVDELVSEEDLPDHLRDGKKPARLVPWQQAAGRLLRRPPRRPGRYVALLTIEGTIVDGQSQRPPLRPPVPLPVLADPRAGDLSVVNAARKALADKRAAAVVLYVNSGGGSATASEAMRAALDKIAARKPLVVAMGPVAASGGYWVSTPGKIIMAQPGAVTGSIGVLMGKLVSAGLLDKLLFNRETVTRGRHALLFDSERRFADDEQDIIWDAIQRTYDLFLEYVSRSRNMAREAVDAIGGGRVWSGRQALQHGLVDELGSLERAIAKARELAGLHPHSRVRLITPGKQPLAPFPDATAAVRYALDGLRLFNQGAPLCLCPIVWDDLGA